MIRKSVEMERKETLKKTGSNSNDKQHQPTGYRQLRRLDMKIYSIVGLKNCKQGCDNIDDRDKCIKDLKNAKSIAYFI